MTLVKKKHTHTRTHTQCINCRVQFDFFSLVFTYNKTDNLQARIDT